MSGASVVRVPIGDPPLRQRGRGCNRWSGTAQPRGRKLQDGSPAQLSARATTSQWDGRSRRSRSPNDPSFRSSTAKLIAAAVTFSATNLVIAGSRQLAEWLAKLRRINGL